ncbi:MAG: RdgB/HAM1 family non-canonical purine NTP pyrophosphatase [Acidimicrobiales bacterium]
MKGGGGGPDYVLATANPDKAAEIRAILGAELGRSVSVVPRPPEVGEVEETGATLEENARLKALALLEATGLASIADDTGLEVDVLGGAPGIYAARYAGPGATYADNVSLLLASLDEAGARSGSSRAARFRTVALCRFPGGAEIVAEGCVEGQIATAPRGDRGFGYDPVFVPRQGDGRTFAEMSAQEKNTLSHRGRAFRALAGELGDAHAARIGETGAR